MQTVINKMAPKLGTVSNEAFLLHLMSKIDTIREKTNRNRSMIVEVRTLEFWRAIIAECLSTFFYVFLLCATHISWTGSHLAHQPNWLVMSFTSGLAMATLCQCFGHISGAHVNPAVTCALLVTSKITPLRAVLYMIAQCGGSIAGAALLYGVSVAGHQGMGPLGISVAHDQLSSWQIFGVEFVLTFLIVFTVFATLDPNRKSLGSDSLSIGIAYLVCSLTGLPSSGASMNPARSLGPAFVMNRWKNHWVYWLGPLSGGILAGLIYEYIFDTKKSGKTIREAFDELERESNIDDDYEDPEIKINNKGVMAYSTTSGTSSGSSSGHRSNHTQQSTVSVHANNAHNNGSGGHYDSFRTMATINAYTPTPATAIDGVGVYGSSGGTPHHVTLPSNNFHQNNSNYSGVYGSSRNYGHNTLRQLPSRMDYSGSVAVSAPGNTKF